MTKQLSEDFLIELAKCCSVSKDFLEIVQPHLKYSFLPTEAHKDIFRVMFDYYGATTQTPTIGIISQKLNDRDSLTLMKKMREVNIIEKKHEILTTFEEFIRHRRFEELHQSVKEDYNHGHHEKAIGKLAIESKAINEFKLTQSLHTRIYADFEKRQQDRLFRDYSSTKIRTGILQFDHNTHGGFDLGTGLLAIARSGVGKSTLLRWLGFQASFYGYNVLHFQAEGKKEEVEDAYDAMWTTVPINNIKEGNLSNVDIKKIDRSLKQLRTQAGEIYVHAFTQFNSATIAECRMIAIELMRYVDIGLIIFDYLELFEPGDGKLYSTNAEGVRARKEATGRKIINVSKEFNVGVATATMASNIKKEDWNNPQFVITREHISNLKATVDPFDYAWTLNQTEDEDDNEIMRIHLEKSRHYKIPSWARTFKIYQIQKQWKVYRYESH